MTDGLATEKPALTGYRAQVQALFPDGEIPLRRTATPRRHPPTKTGLIQARLERLLRRSFG